MPRPQLPIIMQSYKGHTQIELAVIEGPGYWVVTDQGRPINVRSIDRTVHKDSAPKYVKNGWTNLKAAEMLARKLNSYFKTDRFTATKLL